MFVKRHKGHIHISFLAIFISFIAVIYYLYCIETGTAVIGRNAAYLLISNTLMPREFIITVIILTISYTVCINNYDNEMYILSMKGRKSIWAYNLKKTYIIAFIDTMILILTFLTYCVVFNVAWNNIVYIFLAGVSIYLQLCVSFLLIELTKWVFNSQVPGMTIMVALGVSDAYTSFIPLFYRRFSIIDEIVDRNINMIFLKLICCLIIASMLVLSGFLYSDKKDFLCQEK